MTIFLAALAAALVLIAVLYRLWKARVDVEVDEGAAIAWERALETGRPKVDGLTRDQFFAAYRRARTPRLPGYILLAVAAFILTLPVVFAVLSGALWAAEAAGLTAEPADLARYVPLGDAKTPTDRANREEIALYLARDYAGFYYFFGVIAGWLFVVAFVLRRYYARRPGDLNDEVLLERERASAA